MMLTKVNDRGEVWCAQLGCRYEHPLGRIRDGELRLRPGWHFATEAKPPRWTRGKRRAFLEDDMSTSGWQEPSAGILPDGSPLLELPAVLECPRCHAVQESPAPLSD